LVNFSAQTGNLDWRPLAALPHEKKKMQIMTNITKTKVSPVTQANTFSLIYIIINLGAPSLFLGAAIADIIIYIYVNIGSTGYSL